MLRFNFRGVGASEGTFDRGEGEKEDFRAALDYMAARYPGTTLWAAGFSFGSWVALEVGAADDRVSVLIGIAPPVATSVSGQRLRLRQHARERRSRSSSCRARPTRSARSKAMWQFYGQLKEPKELVVIDGADHLFDGKTQEVGEALEDLLGDFDGLNHERRSHRFSGADRGRQGAERHVAATRPDEMAAVVIAEALRRAPGVDPAEIDDVILGCAMPEAEQGLNVARIASLRAGVPVSASAVTVNRFCSSGLQSIAYARRADHGRASPTSIVAGGTESMSLIPMGGHKVAPNPALVDIYPDVYLTTGLVAENHAREASVSREEQDAFALESHQQGDRRDRRADASRTRSFRSTVRCPATAKGAGRSRSTPTRGRGATRRSRRSAKLKPAFHVSGTVTAGNSSQTSDGAAAVVVMAGERARAARPDAARPVRRVRHRRRRTGALRHRSGARDPQGP